jgi:cytochrome P450
MSAVTDTSGTYRDLMTSRVITEHDEAVAILADPGYQVPAAPAVPDGEVGTLAWLRASVGRFSEGADHDRRRSLAQDDLARMDVIRLRHEAAAATAANLVVNNNNGRPFDVMRLARRVPVAVLAAELGMADVRVVDAAIAVSACYLNPDQAGPDADDSVAVLLDALRPDLIGAELAASRIGLLLQACEATAGLIGNALVRFLSHASNSAGRLARTSTIDEILADTLSEDPPVRRTRRESPDGDIVLVDISTMPFGAGRRPCPGGSQAKALAAGVLDALLPVCVRAEEPVQYPDTENLRVPARLLLALR